MRDLLNSRADDREFVVEVETDLSAAIRFGDDRHGRRPDSGTVFSATYRVGNGARGNVGADALVHFVAGPGVAGAIASVRNPLAAVGGAEPESLEDVRQRAPSAFRTQERAVTPADYAEVTERNPQIQQAAATLRWTGSWRTVFLTADRVGGAEVDAGFERELRRFVEPYRMAGQDLEVDAPRPVPLEITLRVCVKPDHFRGDVKAALLTSLLQAHAARRTPRRLPPGQLHLRAAGLPQPDLRGRAGDRRRGFGRCDAVRAAGPARSAGVRGRRAEVCAARNPAAGQRSELPRAGRVSPDHGRREVRCSLSVDPTLRDLNDCGCCEGVTAETPAAVTNRPGLSAVAYRIGEHATFKASMLSALSATDNAEMQALKTRAPDDFTLALTDAWAAALDVLTFYQERLANESYLRTATERLSVLHLARLIGYELRPGVAASTSLAFTLDETAGSPADVDPGGGPEGAEHPRS